MSLFCDDPGTPPPTLRQRIVAILIALAVNALLLVLNIWLIALLVRGSHA